jgi:RHS repeat-associated protein
LKTAGGVTYTYDGDGRRVQKSNGKLYWYGATGDILDETDASGNLTNEYVYFAGKRIARRDSSNNIYYYFADHLGSSRVITQANGTVCYDADYDPFGKEVVVTNTCPQNYKFNGKERDTETNLDDFGARYYSSQFGRWTSPDWSGGPSTVPYAELVNPQSLNLYSFVRNNPVTSADLDGHTIAADTTNRIINDCGGGGHCVPAFSATGSAEDSAAPEFGVVNLEDWTVTSCSAACSQWDATSNADTQAPPQNQDATKWKQDVVDTIKFQKDARAAYEKFGPGAKSVEGLEQDVTKTLEKKYGEIGTAGSTNSSGKVEIKPDPNPYTREATTRHERVHQQTVVAGIAKYGKDTPAFKQWFYNPQNWAKDEVKAYSAGIAYLEQSLRKMDGP